MSATRVAFVQDHLVQRGGAERGLLAMLKAAPEAEIITSFYEPSQCYPEFEKLPIRTFPMNRIAMLRAHHRAALPLLPSAFSHTSVDADVVICGSSGWAQGVKTSGRKIIYFYALPRWLHEREAYLKGSGLTRRMVTRALQQPLDRWDRRTVASGHRFLTEGTVMQRRLREIYGIEAEIVPLPNTIDATAPQRPVDHLDAGFFLCASRLMPYKNIDVVISAFSRLPNERLVIAGDGPLYEHLRHDAPTNVIFLGTCEDDILRWLYAHSAAVVSASIEPFGLTPVEAATFGRPAIALADGGFVDTIIDGVTGIHFPTAHPTSVVEAVDRFRATSFDDSIIRRHALQYDLPTFVERISSVIAQEANRR